MSTGLLNSLMNAQSQTATPAGQQMQVVMIPNKNIFPNPDNEIYSIGNVEGLKDDIRQNGLRQPLEVIPVEGKTERYMLISGHRRWIACTMLGAAGESRFDALPCLIRESHGELDDRIALITANATARDLTDGERLAQYEALKDALTKKKAAGQLEGKVRDEVCRILGLSTGAAARLNVIASCENELIKERLKTGEIGLMEAYRSAQDYARFMGVAPEEPEQKEEPAETVPKTGCPAWVLECAKEVCAFDWVKSAREFTAKALIEAKGDLCGQSLKDGFVDYSYGKIRFWGSKNGEFTFTWARFVKACLENGIYSQNRERLSLDAATAVENKTAGVQTVRVEQNRGMELENAADALEKTDNVKKDAPAILNICVSGNNTLHKLAEKTLGESAAWELEWEDVRFRLAYYKQPLPGGATLWK